MIHHDVHIFKEPCIQTYGF